MTYKDDEMRVLLSDGATVCRSGALTHGFAARRRYMCAVQSTSTYRLWGALGLLALLGAAACAPVKPWERGRLSSPSMQNKLGDAGSRGIYRAKVLETRTGGGLPGEAPGGGCGCTH